jgi:hypothetical protein
MLSNFRASITRRRCSPRRLRPLLIATDSTIDEIVTSWGFE